ncbi:glycosyltransferase family 2 protein [Phormidium tenue]|uniref:Glycosyl transferase family 2 n=1 Tax=Phormidium tenue NIES-30 TaxID=549789 RepID=A0A1U7J1P0_9CYAN|nr:glycosyltransferase [Phormidium tenue]MBD2232254.1 glycosyltransferase [Phormidium tenue FACHB-1052]OKH45811.1 glycosyl transferase family 2 [Phormidium tenue NIES-30]
MTVPNVTLVVSPRERFSYTQTSLESIYKHTQMPFKLVYVDGNSPKPVAEYLAAQAIEKGFERVRVNHFLTPNQARNIGLARVDTPYVVFVDNDVVVSPGWLEALVQCADETGAAIVGPLTCQDEPVHETIHFANGEARIIVDVKGRRRLREKMCRQGQRVAQVAHKLERTPAELVEFHCMLVRTSVFEQLGPLDEGFLNTKEHVDLCLGVAQAGGTIYFEPTSVITYVPGIAWSWADLHLYMLRWSDAWEQESLVHLRQKWNLPEDVYFSQKLKALGWRRRRMILSPLLHRMTFGLVKNRLVEKVLMYGALAPVDRVLNRYLTSRHARLWLQPQRASAVEPPRLVAELPARSPQETVHENSSAA